MKSRGRMKKGSAKKQKVEVAPSEHDESLLRLQDVQSDLIRRLGELETAQRNLALAIGEQTQNALGGEPRRSDPLWRSAPRRLNRLLGEFRPVIDSVGIVIALGLLFYTAQYTTITNVMLRTNQEQIIQEQMPVWDFKANNDDDTIRISPITSGIRLEQCNVRYPQSYFDGTADWPVDPPNFKWYVTMLKSYLQRIADKQVKVEEGHTAVGFRHAFPVAIGFTYTHRGESRSVRGIYWVQYTLQKSDISYAKVTIEDVHFVRFVTDSDDVEQELSSLASAMGLPRGDAASMGDKL